MMKLLSFLLKLLLTITQYKRFLCINVNSGKLCFTFRLISYFVQILFKFLFSFFLLEKFLELINELIFNMTFPIFYSALKFYLMFDKIKLWFLVYYLLILYKFEYMRRIYYGSICRLYYIDLKAYAIRKWSYF